MQIATDSQCSSIKKRIFDFVTKIVILKKEKRLSEKIWTFIVETLNIVNLTEKDICQQLGAVDPDNSRAKEVRIYFENDFSNIYCIAVWNQDFSKFRYIKEMILRIIPDYNDLTGHVRYNLWFPNELYPYSEQDLLKCEVLLKKRFLFRGLKTEFSKDDPFIYSYERSEIERMKKIRMVSKLITTFSRKIVTCEKK